MEMREGKKFSINNRRLHNSIEKKGDGWRNDAIVNDIPSLLIDDGVEFEWAQFG